MFAFLVRFYLGRQYFSLEFEKHNTRWGHTRKCTLSSSQKSKGAIPLASAAFCSFSPCSSVPVMNLTGRLGLQSLACRAYMSATTKVCKCPICGTVPKKGEHRLRYSGVEGARTSIRVDYRCGDIVRFGEVRAALSGCRVPSTLTFHNMNAFWKRAERGKTLHPRRLKVNGLAATAQVGDARTSPEPCMAC